MYSVIQCIKCLSNFQRIAKNCNYMYMYECTVHCSDSLELVKIFMQYDGKFVLGSSK